jgi:hypothetical protein
MVYAYIAARLTSQWTAVNVATHGCSESDPLHPSIDMQEVDKLVRALRLHAREVFEKKDKSEARVARLTPRQFAQTVTASRTG